ncbi:uncharacterized protein LOC120441381 [Oreochromis aureus]|uniref:uncharacterized protein LOC120441381 n=1 Tax=Oreochromis aureus TaxID=47969 RepID=UPI0019545144|nr:uncharacterized protein LOC120441381 [Oreochromis aureus]
MFLFNKHTWHMSLRRKFKSERAPLVDSEAVRHCKEKFGSTRRGQPNKCQRTSQRNVCQGPCVQGEDLLSIDAHLKVLQCQYQKMQPDTMVVHNRMQQTFAWRQKEIADGMLVEDVLKKYPFLGMPTGLCNELRWIQPTTGNVSQRFREGLSCVAAKVIDLTRGKTPLYQLYLDAREEALTDDLPDLDTRAALSCHTSSRRNWISLSYLERFILKPPIQLFSYFMKTGNQCSPEALQTL